MLDVFLEPSDVFLFLKLYVIKRTCPFLKTINVTTKEVVVICKQSLVAYPCT